MSVKAEEKAVAGWHTSESSTWAEKAPGLNAEPAAGVGWAVMGERA